MHLPVAVLCLNAFSSELSEYILAVLFENAFSNELSEYL